MKLILSIDPVRFPLTGIGRYTFELARHLESMSELEDLQYFSGHRFVDALPDVEVTSGLSSHHRHSLLKNRLTTSLYQHISPLIKKQALRKHADHLFHGPNYYLPPFAGTSVCTFHDLSIFKWAHCHPPERVRFMRHEIELTLKRADMLITDTEYTRQEVAAFFNWPLNKIRAVHLACSDDFHPRTSQELIPTLKKYGLSSGAFSLYVGTIEPRKNLEVLLDAYTMLPLPARKNWPLVLIGYQGWGNTLSRIEAAVSEGWVSYLGFVPSADLPLLFAGARLFLFPSLYEGFGLPLLEAMASGTPVVCSNASTLPEVAGNAAAMCDPKDADELSRLIAKGLEDETWRNEARLRGLLRAHSFSWENCAEETLAVYKELRP
jgi:alpha-1,3-rhamnosyl/mannosyltransferase